MAEKLPSGSWRARVTYTDEFGNRKSKSFTAPTEKEADYKAMEFKFGKVRISESANITFFEAAKQYLEFNDAILSPTTKKGYKTALNVWTAGIHRVPLGRLTDLVLQKWVNSLAREGKAPKTVHNAFGFVSAVMAQHSMKPGKVNLPPIRRPEMEIPQRDQVEEIIQAVEGRPEWIAFVLAADCGLRRSEICGLTWDRIDLKRKKIHIVEALVIGDNGSERKSTKTAAGIRTMDMTDRIYKYFSSADTSKPPVQISPNHLTNRFHDVCQDLGYPFHLHTFRHYFASTCAMLGIPENYTVRLMGHATADMIHKVYVHTLDDAEQAFRNKLTSYLNG